VSAAPTTSAEHHLKQASGDGMASLAAAPTVDRVKFLNGGAFFDDTRRDVERYLADPRTRRSGYLRLHLKAPIAIGLSVVSWVLLVVVQPPLALALPCLAGLVIGVLLTGFNVQHDANHGSYFTQRRYNHLLGWTSDTILGISSHAWRVKHNVAHHTYTNVDGYDEDIQQTPVVRLAPSQPTRPWYRFQHIYIWFLYSFMGIRWQLFGDLKAFVQRSVGRHTLRIPSGWNLAALLVGKAVFLAWAVAVPMFFYPWWLVLLAYVGFMMITSFVMATTFQLAHCVEEATFASPAQAGVGEREWAVHQVETTVDFCPENKVLTWALGGLNFQIEHHLFPGVPHTHYPAIAKIVHENCIKHGVRHVTQPSLRAALRSHFRHLRHMGHLGVPVHIEMG